MSYRHVHDAHYNNATYLLQVRPYKYNIPYKYKKCHFGRIANSKGQKSLSQKTGCVSRVNFGFWPDSGLLLTLMCAFKNTTLPIMNTIYNVFCRVPLLKRYLRDRRL